ncbi:MAG TPA: HU family DNA-binding protein [Longimicrobium sp.]|nr:HU family DNA-binding protein [Longimicrobium sp.]
MTKSELAGQIVARTGLSPEDAAAVVDALFAVETGIIAREIAGGGAVELGDFGSFEPHVRHGRGYRRGGAALEDLLEGPPPAPVFRAGAGWRDAGPRMRGGRKPPRGTGSTGPRRGGFGGAPGDHGGAP